VDCKQRTLCFTGIQLGASGCPAKFGSLPHDKDKNRWRLGKGGLGDVAPGRVRLQGLGVDPQHHTPKKERDRYERETDRQTDRLKERKGKEK
jgi:hypothetical protein